MIHFQMHNLKLKVIKVLGKIEMPLDENFSFTLMKRCLESWLPSTLIEILLIKLTLLLISKWLILGAYKPLKFKNYLHNCYCCLYDNIIWGF